MARDAPAISAWHQGLAGDDSTDNVMNMSAGKIRHVLVRAVQIRRKVKTLPNLTLDKIHYQPIVE
jgi:hypothetical protein